MSGLMLLPNLPCLGATLMRQQIVHDILHISGKLHVWQSHDALGWVSRPIRGCVSDSEALLGCTISHTAGLVINCNKFELLWFDYTLWNVTLLHIKLGAVKPRMSLVNLRGSFVNFPRSWRSTKHWEDVLNMNDQCSFKTEKCRLYRI